MKSPVFETAQVYTAIKVLQENLDHFIKITPKSQRRLNLMDANIHLSQVKLAFENALRSSAVDE